VAKDEGIATLFLMHMA